VSYTFSGGAKDGQPPASASGPAPPMVDPRTEPPAGASAASTSARITAGRCLGPPVADPHAELRAGIRRIHLSIGW
jgi:hypothetical protein